MAKTSIIFTRYNNDVRHLYQLPSDIHEYILVDDGSKMDVTMPPNWKIYKITEDIGWNSEGAKNLGVHVAENDWTLTCDLDHPPTLQSIRDLDAMTNFLPERIAYNPVRVDGKAINSYLCHKSIWNEVGGYDETFTGRYGYDVTLARAFDDAGIPRIKLPAISLEIKANARSMSRPEKQAMQLQPSEIFNWDGERTKERLRFPWKRLQ